VLNRPAYRKASILVAGATPAAAPAASTRPGRCLDFGIRRVIAPSFADIFYNNCFKNGILPIALPQSEVDKLMDDAERRQCGRVSIDLEKQEIRGPDGGCISSTSTPSASTASSGSLDDIGLTLRRRPRSRTSRRRTNPRNRGCGRRGTDRQVAPPHAIDPELGRRPSGRPCMTSPLILRAFVAKPPARKRGGRSRACPTNSLI
jgi:3-isopropylmalate dehydratase small subunit